MRNSILLQAFLPDRKSIYYIYGRLPQVNGFEFHGDPIDGGALSALWLLPDLPAEAKH